MKPRMERPAQVSITNTNITGNCVIGLGYVAINYGILGPDGNVGPGGVSGLTVQGRHGRHHVHGQRHDGGPTTVNLSALGTGNSIVGPNTSVTWTFQGHINSSP